MIVAIHQPEYFPSLRYYRKMAQADVWIYLTGRGIMFDRSSYQHRAKIRGRWLTIPFEHTGALQELDDVVFSDRDWPARHYSALHKIYRKDPYWEVISEQIVKNVISWAQTYIEHGGDRISALGPSSSEALLNAGITRPLKGWHDAKDFLPQDVTPSATTRLIQLCQAVGADTYLSGQAGRHYLDYIQFENAGIELRFHTYTNPVPGPELSILDTLFRYGIEQTRQWINGTT